MEEHQGGIGHEVHLLRHATEGLLRELLGQRTNHTQQTLDLILKEIRDLSTKFDADFNAAVEAAVKASQVSDDKDLRKIKSDLDAEVDKIPNP
jgi:hypothetical protein